MSHNGSSGAALDVMRHSAAHVLAKAVQRLYPGSKLGIGPVIDNGFYYDIEIPESISEADLPRIEATMREIIAAREPFKREEWTKAQALEHYSNREDNPYKREIVEGVQARDRRRPGRRRRDQLLPDGRRLGRSVPRTARPQLTGHRRVQADKRFGRLLAR